MLKKLIVFLIPMIMGATEATEVARQQIESLGREAIDNLTSGKLTGSAQKNEFISLLDRGFDMRAIAKWVMRDFWNEMSEDQRSSFTQSYRRQLADKYANRFQEFRGVAFKIIRSYQGSGDGEVYVVSTITKPGGKPSEVIWKLYGDKIYDVKVEGVSMLINERVALKSKINAAGGLNAYLGGSGGHKRSRADSDDSDRPSKRQRTSEPDDDNDE